MNFLGSHYENYLDLFSQNMQFLIWCLNQESQGLKIDKWDKKF